MAMTRNEEEKRPAGLLDLDGTLLKMISARDGKEREIIAESLVLALKNAKIKDLYVFTNMGLDTLVSERQGQIEMSRMQLLAYLNDNGFKIHGVIIPQTVSYEIENAHSKNRPPVLNGAFNDFYLRQWERLENKEIPITSSGQFNQLEPGFAAASNHMSDYKNKTEQLQTQLADEIKYPKPTSRDPLEMKDQLFNVKAIMAHYAIENKPSWVSAFVLIDDEKGVINSVKFLVESKEYWNKKRITPPPIVMLNVTADQKDPFLVETKKSNAEFYFKTMVSQFAQLESEGVVINSKIPKLYTGLQASPELTNLVFKITEVEKAYAELEPKLISKHKGDLQKLLKNVEIIMGNNNFGREEKIKAVVELIEDEYLKNMKAFTKPGFFGSGKSVDAFLSRINNENDKHHYVRLMSFLLSDIYATTNMQTNSSPYCKEQIQKIYNVKSDVYKESEIYNGLQFVALEGSKPKPVPQSNQLGNR